MSFSIAFLLDSSYFMYELSPPYMNVHCMCAGVKRASDTLELDLRMVMRHCVGAGKWPMALITAIPPAYFVLK